jgi:hypothetical protein
MVNNLQSSLDAKAPLASPSFTGIVSATGTGGIPIIKVAPNLDGNESSVAFYRKIINHLVQQVMVGLLGKMLVEVVQEILPFQHRQLVYV